MPSEQTGAPDPRAKPLRPDAVRHRAPVERATGRLGAGGQGCCRVDRAAVGLRRWAGNREVAEILVANAFGASEACSTYSARLLGKLGLKAGRRACHVAGAALTRPPTTRSKMNISSRFGKWISILLINAALISCATGQTMYFQSFNFNQGVDRGVDGHLDADVLNYEYGSSGLPGTRPFKEDWEILAQIGKDYFGQHGIAGMLPRADHLYVKWRVKATGAVYEDRVDLTHRLPRDMTNYELNFAIFGSQLYVFLFPPYKTRDALGQTVIHGGHPPVPPRGETLLDVPYALQHQIYPDLKNKP